MLPVKPLFYQGESSGKIIAKPTKNNIKIIEDSEYLTIPEKVNLLSLLLGYKWVTDLAIDDNRYRERVRDLLQSLRLSYKDNYYIFEKEKHTWIQVAVNDRLLEYIFDNRNKITTIEAGVLYGYPISHVLGYSKLIESEWKNDKSIAEFYLSGVFSKDYASRESDYFEHVWRQVSQLSPKIKKDAEKFYINTLN